MSECVSMSLYMPVVMLEDSQPTYKHHILTVSNGLHAEAQQCMQEVHNVIQGIFVDILAHRLAKLHLVQFVQVGQAVLGLKTIQF